ncbi:MAG: 50S ribosomal protein L11 [Nanoarchaeota archaeon]|nr:50S ribosomal protein L11 [Nanoarchaeota archaeon]
MLVEGGNMKPSPAVSQQLGPMGVNLGKIMSDVNEATKDFKGMKVPVELDINTATKDFTVSVSSPPASELIKKELGLEKGSGQAKKEKAGNISIEQIIKITKTKYPSMIVSDFKAAVKTIVGSCVSLGVLIDNKDPKDIEDEIHQGKYDTEINEQKTEVSPEKKEKLKKFFDKLHAKESADIKAEEEADKLAEEAKAAATAAPAEGEAPAESEEGGAEGEAPAEGTPTPAEKK